LRTICGSKLPLRSRGTARSTAPTSVSTVFGVDPLRLLPLPRPAALSFAGHLRSVSHRVSFREPLFLRLIVRPRHFHSR
jgi:hypothetical protein